MARGSALTVAVGLGLVLFMKKLREKAIKGNNGGACQAFQPTAWSVTREAVVSHFRQCGIMTALCCALWRPYLALVNSAKAKGWSDRFLVCIIATVAHSVTFWTMNEMFLLCDRRRWLERYKLERTEAMGPSDELVREAKLQAVINQFVTGPPAFLLIVYPLAMKAGMPRLDAGLPSVPKLFAWLSGYMIVNDWLFYWAHRLLHDRRIYGQIHKQHHEFKGTIGFAGEHAHAIEQVVANQIPAAAGFLFGGSHFLVFLVYLVCRLERVYEGHSGYCFHGTWLHNIGLTYADATAYHDFHHTKNTGNFGSEFLDYFFGTMDPWIELGGVKGYLALKQAEKFGNVLNNEHPSRKRRA